MHTGISSKPVAVDYDRVKKKYDPVKKNYGRVKKIFHLVKISNEVGSPAKVGIKTCKVSETLQVYHFFIK